jgi:predicted enzyme related to lactoylglutathione lyase
MQNPFVWYDLMTTDVEGAKAFYQKVVGWTYASPQLGYHVTQAGDHGVGGIMETPEHLKGMPPFWSGYVYTPDVDAACKQVVEYGGKVLRQPWNIAETIRMAVVADPDGAVLNIMQPLSKEERTWRAEGAHGTVGWNELHAGSLDAAWDFYSKMFGWTKGHAHDMGPAGVYQLFQVNGKDVGGMMKKMDQTPQAVWLYYFMVDGIDAAAQRVRDAGGTIAMGPHEVPGGQWILHAFDPQGGHLCLLSNTK